MIDRFRRAIEIGNARVTSKHAHKTCACGELWRHARVLILIDASWYTHANVHAQ